MQFRRWRTSTGWQLYAISLAMWPSTIFVWQWCEQIFDHNNPKFFICLRWVCEYYIASCSATYLQLFRWFEDFNSYHGPCACPFVLTLVRYFFAGWPNANSPQLASIKLCGFPPWPKAREMDVYVMGFKGDWKYLYQLFSMTRNPYSEEARGSLNYVYMKWIQNDILYKPKNKKVPSRPSCIPPNPLTYLLHI